MKFALWRKCGARNEIFELDLRRVAWLEGKSLLLCRLLKWYAQLEQLQDDLLEVLKEKVVVLGILLDPGTHLLVFYDGTVGLSQHFRFKTESHVMKLQRKYWKRK